MGTGKIGIVDHCKTLQGIVHYKVYRHINGEKKLIEEAEDKNLIVNLAREQMAHFVAGDTKQRSITHIAFGTSNTEPTVDDTALTSPYQKTVNGFEYPAAGKVQINWSLSVTEANGKAIREFGLFTENGALFARRTRVNPINKENDISIEGTWTIIF